MAQYGAGGEGGSVNAGISPFIPDPQNFIFLNGSSGAQGSESGAVTTQSYGNQLDGQGGSGGTSYNGYAHGGGGAGGAGSYVLIRFNPGQFPLNSNLSYVLGNLGTGQSGASNGGYGSIKVTWG